MVQNTVIHLTDDIDGSDAEETVRFALDGKNYEIDLNKKNAAALRRALKPYIDAGRSARRSGPSANRTTKTLFSQLDKSEKDKFRKWAKLPNARRIGDSRVQEWMKAGRP